MRRTSRAQRTADPLVKTMPAKRARGDRATLDSAKNLKQENLGRFDLAGGTVEAMPSLHQVGAAALLAACLPIAATGASDDVGGFAWNPGDRTAVVAAYARHYLPSEDYGDHVGWNGDVEMCLADSVSDELLDDTLRRINWFRAQAGVSADIVGSADLDAKAQKAALIMAKQGALSHTPGTSFPDNPCLSPDGNLAAFNSNLALGIEGPGAIDFLMRETGNNNSAVGHRRWTLYLRQQRMGNGAIPRTDDHYAAHAQYVFGGFKASPPARAVPWPNEGFIPWQVVPDDGDTPTRWSFSYPGANFSAASVTVERLGSGGGFLAVTKENIASGFGDNTVAWRLDGIPDERPRADITYRVVVSGVTAAPQSTFTYEVTVIDPHDLGFDLKPTGPAAPPIGATASYDFDGFEEAESYSARSAHAQIGAWAEGAEDAPAPRIIDETSMTYALREAAVKASGTKSFHLTAPSYEEHVQGFTIDRVVVPTDSSVLRFKNLRRCASNTTKLEAQVSLGGEVWETVWSRKGKAGALCNHSTDWDTAFQIVEVPIPDEYAGSTLTLRFLFTADVPAFLGSDTTRGFFIDDVSVTDAEELVDVEVTTLPAGATGFDFVPGDQQELRLQVRAEIGEVTYAWSTPTVVTPVAGLCGDATGDGKVTAADALLTLKTAVGSATCAPSACDANGSGGISAADALLILKAAVGTPVELNCPAG